MSSRSESSNCSRSSQQTFHTIERDSQTIQVVRNLGSGSFGECVLVLCPSTNKFLAVKRLSKQHVSSETFQREFEVSCALSSHKNIVKTYSNRVCSDNAYLIFQEWAQCGDLFDWIEPTQGLPLTIVRAVTLQICTALNFMHKQGLVHRDIKPENILVFKADFSNVKVADFGMTLPTGSEASKSSNGIPYSAPESLKSGYRKTYRVEPSADIWSLGILLYCMLTGNFPWELAMKKDTNYVTYLSQYSSISKSSSQHKSNDRVGSNDPTQFSQMDSPCSDLIFRMLNSKAKKRCRIVDVEKCFHSL